MAEAAGASTKHWDGRLSRDGHPDREYDVVVVGSGYGGGVLARRLTEQGRCVAVLERGREFFDDFPHRLGEVRRSTQLHGSRLDVGSSTALLDVRTGPDLSVLVGCGLGGTSLINANVALRPEPAVLDLEWWPAALRADGDRLQACFDLASEVLQADRRPPPPLAREAPFRGIAPALGASIADTLLTMHRPSECTGCGNCILGCRQGADGTAVTSYLREAKDCGAALYTLVRVDAVVPGSNRAWRVLGARTDDPGVPITVEADLVVLAAGTLGSTEILLRSSRVGLPLSRRIGHHFSGNGDFLGVAYDARETMQAMGAEDTAAIGTAGPTITTTLKGTARGKPYLIQDGAVPFALSRLMPMALFAAARAMGVAPPGAGRSRIIEQFRSMFVGPLAGATSRTLILLLTSQDDDDGALRLERDRLVPHWPAVAHRPSARLQNSRLSQAAHLLGATYIPSPLWGGPLRKAMITVHPLGGCAMADDAARGVVDDGGRVFSGPTGTDVHPGLYVADGSIIPRSIGANPSLTITALAERIAQKIGEAESDAVEPKPQPLHQVLRELPAVAASGAATRMSWRERLDGFVSADGALDPDFGDKRGRLEHSLISLRLQVEVPDLDRLFEHPETPCRLSGHVILRGLGAGPEGWLTIEQGAFILFESDPDRVDRWAMEYRMDLVDPADQQRYRLEGIKPLHDNPGADMWPDLTTLRLVVTDQAGGAVCAGKARIGVAGVARMVDSMQVHGVGPRRARWLKTRFLLRFAGHVNEVYGKALATPVQFERLGKSLVTPKRPKHTGEHWFVEGDRWVHDRPADGVFCPVRLTHFAPEPATGTAKGPVILAPGLAMAADSFLGPTEENLVNHLLGRGYDVWLFDYRASTDLRSHVTAYTLDDIARFDWPTAVAHVLEETGRPDLQIVGHCMGSMTAQMAVLDGMKGVRSMVCSQTTVHPRMTPFSRLRAHSRLSSLLQAVGVRAVEPPTAGFKPATALMDLLYRANPDLKGERCSNPRCRWTWMFFGAVHHHDRLTRDAHNWAAHQFGAGGIGALDHIARIARNKFVRAANGDDIYNHPERMAKLPILFLVGELNKIFLPEGVCATMRWLQAANGGGPYERALIPGYAHYDCLAGRNAHLDVFPVITKHLDRYNEP